MISKRKRISVLLTGYLLFTSTMIDLQAGKLWEERAPSQWNEEELRKFLEKSPWATTKTLKLLSDCEGKAPYNRMSLDVERSSSFNRYKIAVIWASDLVKAAMERVSELLGEPVQDRSKQKRTKLMVYIQNQRALPCLLPEGDEESLAGTYLKTKSGKKYEPSKIVFPPAYEHRGYVVFEFPLNDESGKPLFTLKDKEVELFTRIQGRDLKAKFKLKSMRLNGTLAL